MNESEVICPACGTEVYTLVTTETFHCPICYPVKFCMMCNVEIPQEFSVSICSECWNEIQISKITDSLFLSNKDHARDYDSLKELGIKQILSIGTGLALHTSEEFVYMYISIDDDPSQNISSYFDQTYAFIDAAPTLVHCFAGVSRSATIVIAYLMKKYTFSYDDARNLVATKRPFINPNDGFVLQLKNYEMLLKHGDAVFHSEDTYLPADLLEKP